jgi:hypothetical protein
MNALAYAQSNTSSRDYYENYNFGGEGVNYFRATSTTPNYDPTLLKHVIHSSLSSLLEHYSREWISETFYISSPDSMRKNRNFHRLLSFREAIVPFALQKVKTKGDRVRWMVLLKDAAAVDPVPPHKRGMTDAMADEWINWGKEKNLIPE